MMAAHDSHTLSWSLDIFAFFHDFVVGFKFFNCKPLLMHFTSAEEHHVTSHLSLQQNGKNGIAVRFSFLWCDEFGLTDASLSENIYIYLQ